MKIQLFIFGLLVVKTLAQVESSTTKTLFNRGQARSNDNRLRGDFDNTDNSEFNGGRVVPMPHGDGGRHRHHFTHNPDWHRRHGIPLPNGANKTTVRDVDERHHHFTHNSEWHRRHGVPMPVERDHRRHHHDDNHHNRHTTSSTSTTTTPRNEETHHNDDRNRHTSSSTSTTTTTTPKSTPERTRTPEPEYSREM